MSLIVIPKVPAGDTAGKEAAQTKFQAAIDDLATVVMIVYGEGHDIDEVLEVVSARADLRPLIRKVLWVKDHKVLSASQKSKFFVTSKAAVAIGLSDTKGDTLTKSEAKRRRKVERAFTKAEAAQ